MFAKAGTEMTAYGPGARSTAEHLGVAPAAYRLAGAAQLAGAVGLVAGLWLPWLGSAAALGLVLLLVGAFTTHVRARDPWPTRLPALAIAALTATAAVLQQV